MQQTISDRPETLPSNPNIVLAMPLENSPKYYSYRHILIVSDSSLTIKLLFLFLDCVFVCMRRRSRCERGRTHQRAVLQASERGLVLRPRTRRIIPRSGLPGRL